MISRQLKRFILIGLLTVLIDYFFYIIFIQIISNISIAKSISFISGALFAYFANGYWTFNRLRRSGIQFVLFASLYLSSLSINVLINTFLIELGLTNNFIINVNFSFLVATSISALCNYMGMKYIVFK